MKIQGGIRLTEYAPQKKLQKATEEKSDDELDHNPNLRDFEKQTLRRLRDEAEGKIQPRAELNVEVGPETKMPNQISLKDYKNKYTNMGTIGKMDQKEFLKKTLKMKQATL